MSLGTQPQLSEELVREGEELLRARQLPAALHRLNEAVGAGADPDRCDASKWTIYMLLGDYEGAWRLSDAISRRGAPDVHRLWNGERLRGRRVMVRCLHGYGDAVQFLRYAPRLREIAAEVVYEVPPRLFEVATWIKGVEQVVTWGERRPRDPVPWDVQVEVMQLPYVFRTQLHDLPLIERYLEPPPTARGAVLNERFRVGINCTAGRWNAERSIERRLLSVLDAMGGIELFDLRGGEEALVDHDSKSEETWRDYPQVRHSIGGLARAILQMHLVITVDTLAAHLAGAMGVPCWIMLQHEADWRWLHRRTDSPWYPSVQLFRQPVAGNWTHVVEQVAERLERECTIWNVARSIACE